MRILRPQMARTTPCPEQDDGANFKDQAVASASLWLPPCVDDVSWARIEDRSTVTPKLTYDPRPVMKTRTGETVKGPGGRPLRIGELPEQVPISLVRELDDHLVIPRYLCPEETAKVDFDFPSMEDVWSQLDFGDQIEPRNAPQKAVWEALSEADNGTLKLACGKGKALAHGEPVRTPHGWTAIEDLQVGDLVAGTDGRFHAVLGVFPQGQRALYRVTFTEGTWVDCDADHLWELDLRRSSTRRKVIMMTSELAAGPLKNKAGRKYYLPPVSAVAGTTVAPLPLDPYTLGVLLGDGGISGHTVNITTADMEILENCTWPHPNRAKEADSSNSGAARCFRISPSRKNAHNPNSVRRVLNRLGLRGVTSHTKFVPEPYLRAAPHERLALLQGLFDTDGTHTAAKVVEYTTVSPKLMEHVTDLAYSLGGTCTVRLRQVAYKGSVRPAFRALVKLPAGLASFRLERKQAHMRGARQREPARAVKSVKFLGTGLATCITVDSPDSLFLTRNYVPTHNTVMSLKKLAQRGFPGIVLVNNRGLAHQWKLRAMQFLDLQDQDIGMVTSGLDHRDAYHVSDNPKLLAEALVRCDSAQIQLLRELESFAGHGFNPLSGKHVQQLVDRVCTPMERLDYMEQRAKCLHAWADEGKAPFTLLREYREVLYEHRLLQERIEGGTPIWNRPLVISTIQSLVSSLRNFPQWIRQRFGTVFFDEGHHLPAATFIRAIDVFHGARFSLTATPERDDGLESLMYAHTGDIIYEDMEPEYPAKLFFTDLPTRLAMDDKATRSAVLDKRKQINLGKLYQYLAMDHIRNRQIIRKVVLPALNKGRDVLVLAHAEAHPAQLALAFQQVSPTLAKASGVGVITGETSGVDRVRILSRCRACFATVGVALEGLDAPRKDTVVMATAFTSWRMLVQSKGRIERLFEGKPQPLYLIISDTKIDILKGMSWALKRKLQRHDLAYSG